MNISFFFKKSICIYRSITLHIFICIFFIVFNYKIACTENSEVNKEKQKSQIEHQQLLQEENFNSLLDITKECIMIFDECNKKQETIHQSVEGEVKSIQDRLPFDLPNKKQIKKLSKLLSTAKSCYWTSKDFCELVSESHRELVLCIRNLCNNLQSEIIERQIDLEHMGSGENDRVAYVSELLDMIEQKKTRLEAAVDEIIKQREQLERQEQLKFRQWRTQLTLYQKLKCIKRYIHSVKQVEQVSKSVPTSSQNNPSSLIRVSSSQNYSATFASVYNSKKNYCSLQNVHGIFLETIEQTADLLKSLSLTTSRYHKKVVPKHISVVFRGIPQKSRTFFF